MDCVSQRAHRESIFAYIEESVMQEIHKEFGISGNKIGSNFYALLDAAGMASRRQIGCYLGMVLGDSLGAPLEFIPVTDEIYCIDIQISNNKPVQPSPNPATAHLALSSTVGTVSYPYGWRNVFHLEPGQWTDDAAMGACLADSLIVNDDKSLADTQVCMGTQGEEGISKTKELVDSTWFPSFSGRDIRSRFWNWANNGYNNAFKHSTINNPYRSVGLGGNISKSLAAINNTPFPEISDYYISATDDSGNGGLMRLAPIPVFYARAPVDLCMKYCGMSSQTTHPGVLATRAAECMGFFIHRAINRPPEAAHQTAFEFAVGVADEYMATYCATDSPLYKEGNDTILRLLASNEPMGSTEVNWNWRDERLGLELCMHNRGDTYNGYPNHAGYFGSYCLDGFAVALHSFAHTSSFTDSLVKCINYRGDADSTGSICGQLAGAFYGADAIPAFLINSTLPWDDSDNIIRAVMLTTWYRDNAARESGGGGGGEVAANVADDNNEVGREAMVASKTDEQRDHHYTTSYPDYPERIIIAEESKRKSILGSIFSFFSKK
jgi:ADP-ribosyl-[dinitrogen reductase] hydrolase